MDDTEKIEVESSSENLISGTQLYDLYYLSASLNIIEHDNKSYEENIISIDPTNLLNEENQGLLFDIWLYVNLLNEHNLSVDNQKKERIINLLSSLQSKDGFFISNYSEDININTPEIFIALH